MRAYEFIEEDVSRRDFLRWMGAGSMAAAGAGAMTGDAEAAEWMSPKDFGYDRWFSEGKKLITRCQPIIKKLVSVAGPEGPKVANIVVSTAVVPGQATVFGDGQIILDPAIYYDLSDDTLAFLIGHEMGHLVLGHKGYKGISPKVTKQQELDADVWGGKLAFSAGYNPNQAFSDMSMAAKRATAKPSDTHPDYKTRVKNLNKGLGVTNVAAIQDLQHNAQAILKFATAMA
jgi:Zn-dependent protease with chaperone function